MISALELNRLPSLIQSAAARGLVRFPTTVPGLEPLDGLHGYKRRHAWYRNKRRKLNAQGLSQRGTTLIYKKWPILEMLHGKVRKAARQQLERGELLARGLTVHGTPRRNHLRRITELAHLPVGSREYQKLYMRLKRAQAKQRAVKEGAN